MWTYNTDYLAHFGIPGMKWGVRRYQNEDGSLTPAGQKRYGTKNSEKESDKSNKTKNMLLLELQLQLQSWLRWEHIHYKNT